MKTLNHTQQANRDVTRMEIFMSLVQAFEETMKGIAMPKTAIGNHPMPQHSIAGATSGPASGINAQ